MMDSFIARACETAIAYLAQGNERFEADGAVFLRNRSTPRRHDVNSAALVRNLDDAGCRRLIRRIEAEYEGFGHRQVHVDPLSPPELAALLTIEGYKASDGVWLVLEGDPPPASRRVEIREVVSDADWAAYQELDKLWWLESGVPYFGQYDAAYHDELTLSKRLKSPAVRNWLAIDNGEAAAFLSSFPGENGVGMVEDLFTHPDHRHRGLASALLAHCVADARARGADPVIIAAHPGDTPKQMYVDLGFRPFMVARSYLRTEPVGPAAG